MSDFDLKQYLKDNNHLVNQTHTPPSDDFDVNQYIQANKSNTPPQMPMIPPESPSLLTSLGTGAANLGANNVMAAEKGLTGGLTGVAAGLGAGLGSVAGGGEFIPAYKEGLNERKQAEQAESAKNPLTSKAVEMAASIPTMMVGGGALSEAGMASPVAQGMTLGATTGLTNYLGQNASPTASGASTATGLGGVLGAIGGKLSQGVSNLLNPEDLEASGSKMAQEAMAMNSSKDLTSQYNPMTGQVDRGSNIIKGTGTTAIDQGVLKGSPGKWYDNAINALKSNYQKLPGLLNQAQAKLEPNLEDIMQNVGPITTKSPQIMQKIFDEIPTSSQRNLIIRKITNQFGEYEQKLAQADGNLPALNQVKQELTQAAETLAPQIYGSTPPTPAAKAEATLYKRLGGLVRQQIEDLANAAAPGMGDQIYQVNQTIGNLSSMLPSLQKATRGGLPTSLKDVAQTLMGPVESFAAKGLTATSRYINTPIGQIAQKAAVSTPTAITTSPWLQNKVNSTFNEPNSAYITRVLSNATPESLRQVAQKFQQDPATHSCGEMLQKAVDNDDMDAKNRAIFCASQIYKARELLNPESK